MKRKIVGILLTGMIIVSLVGCGKQVKATDQEVAGEETIIVTDDESYEDTTVNTENEITETYEDNTSAVETDGEIVFYDKIGDPEYGISAFTFEPQEEKAVTAVDEIPIYSEEGIKVGYVKSGATVILTEHGINSRWYRFENPINNTDYDYLCMLDDDIPIDENELLTADEVKEWIVERINNRDFAAPVFLDAPDSDMEYVDFSIDRQADYPDATWIINEVLFFNGFDVGDFFSGDYGTFCVECTKNDMNIDCRIYYKDRVE